MALIICYECGGRISDKANACPHCGAPSEKIIIEKNDVGIVIDGVRWATHNLGSSKIEGFGKYYTWEEAKRACPQGWRLPTCKELQSLFNVNRVRTEINGILGENFGNKIFLPAAGCYRKGSPLNIGREIFYWSSEEMGNNCAYLLRFDSRPFITFCDKTDRCSVRYIAENTFGHF